MGTATVEPGLMPEPHSHLNRAFNRSRRRSAPFDRIISRFLPPSRTIHWHYIAVLSGRQGFYGYFHLLRGFLFFVGGERGYGRGHPPGQYPRGYPPDPRLDWIWTKQLAAARARGCTYYINVQKLKRKYTQ